MPYDGITRSRSTREYAPVAVFTPDRIACVDSTGPSTVAHPQPTARPAGTAGGFTVVRGLAGPDGCDTASVPSACTTVTVAEYSLLVSSTQPSAAPRLWHQRAGERHSDRSACPRSTERCVWPEVASVMVTHHFAHEFGFDLSTSPSRYTTRDVSPNRKPGRRIT